MVVVVSAPLVSTPVRLPDTGAPLASTPARLPDTRKWETVPISREHAVTWLVVGLGNPGSKYERNRHNIGFMVVDELARKHALPAWATKLGGDATSGLVTTERGRERAQLLKPMEFMNLSGFAVQRAAAFHKVDVDQILVVHDEIDLPFGTVRLKAGGGHGGHNGLRSIIEQLGESKFHRLRMGVGRDPNAPPGS